MKTKWECRQHDCGWLIVANRGGVEFASLISRGDWRQAHDPEWTFWAAVESLTRSVNRYPPASLRDRFEQHVREQCDIPFPEYFRLADSYNRPDLATKWRWFQFGASENA